jgi:hypothetical protein
MTGSMKSPKNCGVRRPGNRRRIVFDPKSWGAGWQAKYISCAIVYQRVLVRFSHLVSTYTSTSDPYTFYSLASSMHTRSHQVTLMPSCTALVNVLVVYVTPTPSTSGLA